MKVLGIGISSELAKVIRAMGHELEEASDLSKLVGLRPRLVIVEQVNARSIINDPLLRRGDWPWQVIILVRGPTPSEDRFLLNCFEEHIDLAPLFATICTGEARHPEAVAVAGGKIAINFAKKQVRIRDQSVTVTEQMFELLAALAQRRGEPVSREELIAQCPHLDVRDVRSVDVAIGRLCTMLNNKGLPARQIIQTVRNRGYRLVP